MEIGGHKRLVVTPVVFLNLVLSPRFLRRLVSTRGLDLESIPHLSSSLYFCRSLLVVSVVEMEFVLHVGNGERVQAERKACRVIGKKAEMSCHAIHPRCFPLSSSEGKVSL